MLQIPQEQIKETRVATLARTDTGCHRKGEGEGCRCPYESQKLSCHLVPPDVLFQLLEAGGMINNSVFILQKISCINLLWEKITLVTTEHLCQKENTFVLICTV